MEIFYGILAMVGGNAALLIALGWLSKSIIEKILKRDLSRYELELKGASDLAIERFRAEMSQRITEHQIRFSRLHEKSAETIAETYSLLQEYMVALGAYVNQPPLFEEKTRTELSEAMTESLNKFRAYYNPRQIFLPKDTAIKITELDFKISTAARTFTATFEGQDKTSQPEKWFELYDDVNKEIPAVLERLEDEFRKILGYSLSSGRGDDQ